MPDMPHPGILPALPGTPAGPAGSKPSMTEHGATVRPGWLTGLLVFLTVSGVAGASCARASQPESQPVTARVGIGDVGESVELRPGDRLVIDLAEEGSAVRMEWSLAGYPRDALDVIASDEEAGRFEFEAAGEGGGRIQLSGRPTCEKPLVESDGGIQCPLLGAGSPGGLPVRLFVITVLVRTD